MSSEESLPQETDRPPLGSEDLSEGPHESSVSRRAHHTWRPERGDAPSPVTEADDDDVDIVYVPVTPKHIAYRKYSRHYFIPRGYEGEVPTVKALQTDFRRYDPPSSQSDMGEFTWVSYQAPEGNLYFRDEMKRIMTFVDLYNQSYNDAVSKCARILLRKISRIGRSIPEDYEIVIMMEDYEDGGGYGYGYYLVSWKKRCLFWLEDVDSYRFLTQESRICITESHVGKQMESLFWLHIEMFPNHYDTPEDVVDDLKDALNYGIFDHVSSRSSIFPYDNAEATEILECLNRVDASKRNAKHLRIVARCAYTIAEYEFMNYHGERGAYIGHSDNIEAATVPHSRSLRFIIISTFFLFLPIVHLRRIENARITDSVERVAIKQLRQWFEESWNESIVPATVILSTNVGFLAIQTIDTNHSHRSVAQMAAYISSAFAFFNITTIQVLKIKGSPARLEVSGPHERLDHIERRRPSLESMALLFSLPMAFLIWSMISFLVALMVVYFSGTSIITRTVMAVVMTLLGAITAFLGFVQSPSASHETINSKSPSFTHILQSILQRGAQLLKKGLVINWEFHRYLRRRRYANTFEGIPVERPDVFQSL